MVDYQAGDRSATLTLYSDLGAPETLPVSWFFRGEDDLFPFEEGALEACRGRVLDLGAGAGVHSLLAQRRGHPVTAVELQPQAAAVMRARGVLRVVEADFLAGLDVEPADTVLMLMNGVGPAGTLEGLGHFLWVAPGLLRPGGQLLVDSAAADVAADAAPLPGVAGRRASASPAAYEGEAWVQLEYDGLRGEPFRELYVDAGTLGALALGAGWHCDLLFTGADDSFLARLTR